MKEAIGSTQLLMIVIVLLLIFTAYLCFSINYTTAFKTTDSIINQIKLDEGANIANINESLSKIGYTSSDECDDGWDGFRVNSVNKVMSGKANYCIRRVLVSEPEMPPIYYYQVRVFYNVDVPLLSAITFGASADSPNIYAPDDSPSDIIVANGEVQK